MSQAPEACNLKLFYSSNCCCIVTSQSVCLCLSVPPQYNICRQGWSLPQWSPLLDSTLMEGSQDCPQILDQGGSEWQWQTLAYYDKAKFTSVKCYIVQTPGDNPIKLFTVLAGVVVSGKPIQPSLMFAGKTGAYPSGDRAPLQGRLLALPTNMRLGRKGLSGTNAVAYYENP